MARATYTTEQELQAKIDDYFLLYDGSAKGKMPNKAGICVHLGISQETYSQYRRHRFPEAIKGANDRIEQAWVQRLAENGATGAIFYLKNAFKEKYRDRYDVTSGGKSLGSSTKELDEEELRRIAAGSKGGTGKTRTS